MTTTPNPTAETWEERRKRLGWPTPNHMRRAADGLSALSVANYGGILRYVADLCDGAVEDESPRSEGDLTEEQITAALDALSRFNEWTDNPRGAVRAALTAAGVAPQKLSECSECHRIGDHKLGCGRRRDAAFHLPAVITPHESQEPSPASFDAFGEPRNRAAQEPSVDSAGNKAQRCLSCNQPVADCCLTYEERARRAEARGLVQIDQDESGNPILGHSDPASPSDREMLVAEADAVVTAGGNDSWDEDADLILRLAAALAAQPVLDPEKVAEWLGTEMPRKSRDETYGQYDRRCARALCEAAKRGELNG